MLRKSEPVELLLSPINCRSSQLLCGWACPIVPERGNVVSDKAQPTGSNFIRVCGDETGGSKKKWG